MLDMPRLLARALLPAVRDDLVCNFYEAAKKGFLELVFWAFCRNLVLNLRGIKQICRIAASEERLYILQGLYALFVKESKYSYVSREIAYVIVCYAAAVGRLDILDWAERSGYTTIDADIYVYVAERNNLDMLKWLRKAE